MARRLAAGAAPARSVCILLAGALAAALAGCGHLPPPPRMAQALPPAWHNAADANDPRPPLDLTRWWTGFHDPTLDGLIRRAATENLTLRQAASRVTEARAMRHETLAALSPWAIGGMTVQGERLVGNDKIGNVALPAGVPGSSLNGEPIVLGRRSYAYYEPGVSAAWQLPLFGRGAATGKLAAGNEGMARAAQAAARVALVSDIARNYVTLRADQQSQALLTASRDAAENLLRLVEIRRRAGLASDLDVDEARDAADQLATRLAPLDGAVRASLQQLAVLCGSSEPDPALAEPAPLPAPPTASLHVVPADLLRLRPDILEAEQNVVVHAGALGIAVADLYPQFTLVGSIGAVGSLEGAAAGPTGLFSGGPAISIPLLDWGARMDEAKARNAALAESILHYREAVLTGVAAVETSLAQIAAARHQVVAAQSEVTSAEHRLADAKLLYTRGLTSLSERLNADRSWLDARMHLVDATQSEAVAAISLYQAIGGAMPDQPSQEAAR